MHKLSVKVKTYYLGITSLLVATMIYGVFSVLSRLIGYSLPLYYQTGLRAIFAALVIYSVYKSNVSKSKWIKPTRKDFNWMLLRGFFGTVAIICFFIAVNRLTIGSVYFILYAGSTIGGYLLGKLLFKEVITPVKVISLVLAVIGLYFIYTFSINSSEVFFGILSLTAGLATALWNTLSKKISHTYPTMQLSFLDNLLGGVFALLFSLIMLEQWVLPSFTTPWILNGIFGLFYVLTGWLVVNGFKYVEAQLGSLIMLSEVIFGLLIGYFLYKEQMSFFTVLGGTIVFVAISLPEMMKLIKRKTLTMNNR